MKILSTLLTFIVLLVFSVPLFSNVDVNGTVNYHNENKTPLSGVKVLLTDLNGNIIAEDISKDDGQFEFEDVIPGTYKLSASSEIVFDNVDLSDAYLLLGYLLGQVEFDHMQLLAIDINQDKAVDWQDFWNLVNGWFLNGENYMIGKLIFEEKEIVVEDAQLKTEPIVEGVISGNVGEDPPVIKPRPTTKNEKKNIELEYRDFDVNRTLDPFKLPIYFASQEAISGMSLIINVTKGFDLIEEVIGQNQNINYSMQNGQIRITWLNYKNETLNDQLPIISLKVKSLQKGAIELEVDKSSHLIGMDGKIKVSTLILPKLINNMDESELLPIYPNPVRDHATIQYRLSNDSHVVLSIYNTSGQLIKILVDENQSANFYSNSINVNTLNLTSGNYIYRLNCMGEKPFSDAKVLIVR